MENITGNYEDGLPSENGSIGKIVKKKKIQRMSAYTKPTFMLLCEKFPGVANQIKFTQEGPIHQPVFTAELELNGQKFTQSGASKKIARLLIAEKAVAYFNLREEANLAAGQQFNSDDLMGSTNLSDEPMADTTFVGEATNEPVGKNSVSILVFLRPGLNFSIDQGENVVKCAVTVDGVRFEHTAANKKLAKGIVASLALTSLFGLQFVSNSTGMPIFVGQDEEWQQFKAEEKTIKIPSICENKNPIQFLHELYPNIDYDEVTEEQSIEEFGHRFTVSLNIENKRYLGSGNTKKAAKYACSVAAIEGLLEKRILPNLLAQKKLNKKTSKYNIPAWNEKGKLGASAIRLAIHFPSIQYNLISQTPNADGTTLYTVGSVIKNEYYTGTGLSIALARDNLAELVLNKLGLAIADHGMEVSSWSSNRGRGRGAKGGYSGPVKVQRSGLGYTPIESKPVRGRVAVQQQFRPFKAGGIYDPSKTISQYPEANPYPAAYGQSFDYQVQQAPIQSQYQTQNSYYQAY